MKIDYPAQSQINDLRALWKQAFGDEDAFIDLFFNNGFSPDRCRCVTVDGKLAGALYWFDCSFQGHPMAYLYGVATDKSFRGKGICRALTENAHAHLKYLGYDGAVLGTQLQESLHRRKSPPSAAKTPYCHPLG